MDKLCIVIFAILVSLCAAQQNCPTPKEWEARLFETSSTRGDRFARISYDAIRNRTRIIEEVFVDENREYYDELFLHTEGMGYRLNLKTKECEKFKLTEPFRRIEVPPGAKPVGEVEIGTSALPGAGVLVQMYTEDLSRGRYFGEWIPVDHNCLPVSDTYFDRVDKSITHWSFFDIIGGIKDPNVFKPPEECK